MTNEKPISEIEAELYEVLASKELRFGLRFQILGNWDNSPDPVECIVTHVYKETREHNGRLVYFKKDFMPWGTDSTMDYTLWGDKARYKIIGHEPTMARVVDFIWENVSDMIHLEITPKGFHLFDNESNCMESQEVPWNRKEDFDNQTEKTKRKLHALICN